MLTAKLNKRAGALVSAALALSAIFTGVALGASSGPYVATLDGEPASPAPMPGVISDFDVQVHSRDPDSWFTLPPVNAQHGDDCSAPPATHLNSSYEGSVFQCRNHIMTSINGAAGYAEIVLTPNQLVDFSSGPATIRWDVSSQNMSIRDWWDVWVTPWQDNKALPVEPGAPDLSGPPLRGFRAMLGEGRGALCPDIFKNGAGTLSVWDSCNWWMDVDSFLQPSATARATWELTISRTHVKGCLVSANGGPVDSGDRPLPFCFFDLDVPDLGFDQGVVQFAQHSYTPEKDGAGVPATWHWDNFAINPAVPFSLIKADRRYTQGGQVNFAAPAPGNAFLRFAANGGLVEINDGSGWRAASPQLPAGDGFGQSSYFVPIPQGTQSVQFRLSQANSWFGGPFIAKDFSIWSKDPSSSTPPANTPTPTPTRTPTATPTVAQPTATPTGNASASLSGQVVAEGRASASGIRVELSPGGLWVSTGADGSFRFDGLTQGQTITVTASLPGFVDARRANLQVVAGTNNVGKTVLKAGDINDDGAVTITDVSLVAGIYGSTATTGMPHDQNGNGVIDITDVSLTAGNYGLAGPTNW